MNNVAAFVITLIAGILSIFQSGCVMTGGSLLSDYDDDASIMLLAGFLVFGAAITGITGGALALKRNRQSIKTLWYASLACFIAWGAGATSGYGYEDALMWCIAYGVAAVLTMTDRYKAMPSEKEELIRKLLETGDRLAAALNGVVENREHIGKTKGILEKGVMITKSFKDGFQQPSSRVPKVIEIEGAITPEVKSDGQITAEVTEGAVPPPKVNVQSASGFEDTQASVSDR